MFNPTSAAVIPAHIAEKLPPLDLLKQVLEANIINIPAGYQLVRAAWNVQTIWQQSVRATHRYGPPDSLKTAAGYPFFWCYIAGETTTTVWEAELCKHPATHPGRFIVEAGAENALIATLTFDRPLRLFDLSGDAASKLGIYDQLRSPDREWCQWLGVVLDQILMQQDEQVFGFVYPSRRHPGALAYAISSRVSTVLAQGMTITTEKFGDSATYAKLLGDPCHIARHLL